MHARHLISDDTIHIHGLSTPANSLFNQETLCKEVEAKLRWAQAEIVALRGEIVASKAETVATKAQVKIADVAIRTLLRHTDKQLLDNEEVRKYMQMHIDPNVHFEVSPQDEHMTTLVHKPYAYGRRLLPKTQAPDMVCTGSCECPEGQICDIECIGLRKCRDAVFQGVFRDAICKATRACQGADGFNLTGKLTCDGKRVCLDIISKIHANEIECTGKGACGNLPGAVVTGKLTCDGKRVCLDIKSEIHANEIECTGKGACKNLPGAVVKESITCNPNTCQSDQQHKGVIAAQHAVCKGANTCEGTAFTADTLSCEDSASCGDEVIHNVPTPNPNPNPNPNLNPKLHSVSVVAVVSERQG